MTFLVQSSSVFTSTITPLVGMGLIELATAYPLFLGANVGTTTTGLLAALARDPTAIHDAMQVSFVHLLFNLNGILLFFPIPFMRIPIPLSEILGCTTSKYRWFAMAYLLVMFVILPLFIVAISLNEIVFIAIGTPCLIVFVFAVFINFMQRKHPKFLPGFLRTWNWLPTPLHSLGVYDR